jgi:hypothetical protein
VSTGWNLALCLIFAYHPLVREFIDQVLTEFLFTGLLFLIMFLRNKRVNESIITFLFVLLCHTRSVGFVFVTVYLLNLLWEARKENSNIVSKSAAIVLFFLVYFLIDRMVCPQIASDDHAYYASLFYGEKTSNLFKSLPIFFKHLLLFFEFECPSFLNYVFKGCACVFLVIGLFTTRKILKLTYFSSFIYVIVIFPWTLGFDVTRMIIPVFPFFMLLIFSGLEQASGFLIKNSLAQFTTLAFTFISLFCLQIKTGSLRTVSSSPQYPTSSGIQSQLESIRTLSEKNQAIAFCKPFVIRYYCERDVFAFTDKIYTLPPETDLVVIVPRTEAMKEALYNWAEAKTYNCDTVAVLNDFYLLRKLR